MLKYQIIKYLLIVVACWVFSLGLLQGKITQLNETIHQQQTVIETQKTTIEHYETFIKKLRAGGVDI